MMLNWGTEVQRDALSQSTLTRGPSVTLLGKQRPQIETHLMARGDNQMKRGRLVISHSSCRWRTWVLREEPQFHP